mgnify:CR=1 FL=1
MRYKKVNGFYHLNLAALLKAPLIFPDSYMYDVFEGG